ncbi:MAG: hypothetical protein K2I79_02445 [Clostridia bacterium]|nr:hypothetical protein [Clostridia bacterium]
MGQFYSGTYYLRADDKGRLRIPQKLRAMMNSEKLHLVYSANGCLSILTEEEHERLMSQYDGKVTICESGDLKMSRFIAGSVADINEDNQGRFTVPAAAKKFANINKDVVFVGVITKVELWDAERYEAYCSDVDYDYMFKNRFVNSGDGASF